MFIQNITNKISELLQNYASGLFHDTPELFSSSLLDENKSRDPVANSLLDDAPLITIFSGLENPLINLLV